MNLLSLRRTTWSALHDLLLLAAVLLCAGTFLTFLFGVMADGGAGSSEPGTVTIAAAAFSYLVSHGFRAIRLCVLLGDRSTPLKRIVTLHGLTAGLGMLLPWKGSEAVRVGELSSLLGSMPRALATVWIERAFDLASAMLLFLFITLLDGRARPSFLPLVAVWAAFIILSIFIFRVLPENIVRLKLFVLGRYEGLTATRLLRFLQGAEAISVSGREAVRERTGSLAILTLAIWFAELLTYALAMDTSIIQAMSGVLDVISAVPGGTIVATSAFVPTVSQPELGGASLHTYLAVIVLTALALGATSGSLYLYLTRKARLTATKSAHWRF